MGDGVAVSTTVASTPCRPHQLLYLHVPGQHLCLPPPPYSCCLSPNPARLTLDPCHVDKVAASEELFSHTILTPGEVFWGLGVSKKGSRTPLPGQMSLGTRKEAESGHMAGTTFNPMASHRQTREHRVAVWAGKPIVYCEMPTRSTKMPQGAANCPMPLQDIPHRATEHSRRVRVY